MQKLLFNLFGLVIIPQKPCCQAISLCTALVTKLATCSYNLDAKCFFFTRLMTEMVAAWSIAYMLNNRLINNLSKQWFLLFKSRTLPASGDSVAES